MNWEKEKISWPHSNLSLFLDSYPHIWHIQDTISYKKNTKKLPTVLLIHGAGASTHSWRLILNKMESAFRVILVDLPGHGFTKLGIRNRSNLDNITTDLALMLRKLKIEPNLVVGHSAGSAIAINLALKATFKLDCVVCLNGALGNFTGLAGILYPFLAKLLAMSPFTVPLFTSLYSSKNQVEKFLGMTGSKISSEGIAYYKKLISDKNHVEGTLSMMSQWNLNKLTLEWKNLEVPTYFILGEQDNIVQNSDSLTAAKEIKHSRVQINANHGHLMHEEDPDLIFSQILTYYRKYGSF